MTDDDDEVPHPRSSPISSALKIIIITMALLALYLWSIK